MTIDQLIKNVTAQLNGETLRYNDLTEDLNRANDAGDTDMATQLQRDRRGVSATINTLRERLSTLDEEKRADEAISELQSQSHPTQSATGGRGVRSDGKGFLSLRASGRELRAVAEGRGGFNVRALVAAGSVAAPVVQLEDGPVSLGKPATALLDVIPARVVESGQYSYLRQTVRTNNAAPVAIGAQKPASVMTLERVNGTLEVVAHISEAIAEQWLDDVPSLEMFIETEMAAGVASALEDQLLNGTGISPSLLGIVTTASGTQAYATSPLVTIRTGIAQLEAAGLVPSAVVLAASDWLDIETATITGGAFLLGDGGTGAPLDRIKRTLWGVPVVVSTAHAAGTAVLLSEDSVGLVTDGDVMFEFGRIGDDFQRNQVRGRAELRAQVEVYRPAGIIVADLTAA